MRFFSRAPRSWRGLDAPRIVAGVVVVVGHLVLVLLLHTAMRTPDFSPAAAVPGETSVTLEFLVRALPAPATLPPPQAEPPPARERLTRNSAKASVASTSAIFLDDLPIVSEPQRSHAPRLGASDVFDPPPPHKPFPTSPRFSSNLPQSVIRLPDRVSVLQSYWAVPEGENLQGRYARKVPLLGILLNATGAIGGPYCPPKSEHPECLQRLLDGRSP